MVIRKEGITLVALAALLGSLAGCLPKPDEPIEYLARPDAVVLQMLNESGTPQPEIATRLTVPDFTLYGDGTLIFTRLGSGVRPRLLQAQLPEKAVRDLLKFIVNEGFLEFAYDQARPGLVYDAPTTYLYVHTKTEANAVTANALGIVPLEDAGKEFGEFRRLEKIKQRLDELDPEALGGTVQGDFVSDAVLLAVRPADGPNVIDSPAVWLFPEIDLEQIAPPGAGIVEQRIEGETARKIDQELMASGPFLHTFQQGDRVFQVGYRLLLPFEENFPEFD